MRFGVLSSLLVLAAAAFFLGGRMIDHDFVLDAVQVVKHRPILAEGHPLAVFREPWWPAATGDRSLYRPLSLLVFMIVGGRGDLASATPFNEANLVLHLLNAFLRFALVLLLMRGRSWRIPVALAAALVPTIHAVSWESVVGIVGAAELLAGAFMTISFIVFTLGWEGRGPARGGLFVFLAVFAWFLALLSKETAVFFPLVPVFQVLLLRSEKRARPAVFVLALVLAVGAAAGYLAMRRATLGEFGLDSGRSVYAGFSTPERLASSLAVTSSRYVPELAWPRRLEPNITHQDVPPPEGFGDRRVLFGILVWLALGAWLLRATLGGRPEALFIFFAIVTYLPASNLIVPIGAVGAWRFLYSPLFGLAAALAMETQRAFHLRAVRRFVLAPMLGSLALFGALGAPELIASWQDGRTLFARALELNPTSPWAIYNHAVAEFEADRSPERFRRLAQALDVYGGIEDRLATLPDGRSLDLPTREVAFRMLMNLAAARGTIAQEEQNPDRAANQAHDGVRAALRAETLFFAEPARVLEARLAAFRLRQLEVTCLRRQSERNQEAETFVLQEAASDLRALDALDAEALGRGERIELAVAAAEYGELIGDRRLAAAYLDRAAELDPAEPGLASVRARLHARSGDKKKALAVLEKVIEARRGGIDQYALAAELLRGLGRETEAKKYRLAILDLEPKNPVEARIRADVLREFGIGDAR